MGYVRGTHRPGQVITLTGTKLGDIRVWGLLLLTFLLIMALIGTGWVITLQLCVSRTYQTPTPHTHTHRTHTHAHTHTTHKFVCILELSAWRHSPFPVLTKGGEASLHTEPEPRSTKLCRRRPCVASCFAVVLALLLNDWRGVLVRVGGIVAGTSLRSSWR